MNDKIPQKHLNQFILNSCFSKKAYSLEEAKEVAYTAYENSGTVLMPYKCNYCKKIHLSEKSKNKRYTDLNKTINLNHIKPRDTNKYQEQHHCKKSNRLLKPRKTRKPKHQPVDHTKERKVCSQCNKSFYRDDKITDHNWQNKKYCSKACRNKAADDKVWYKK